MEEKEPTKRKFAAYAAVPRIGGGETLGGVGSGKSPIRGDSAGDAGGEVDGGEVKKSSNQKDQE